MLTPWKESYDQYSCLENPMDGGAWWAKSLSRARLFVTPWTAAYQAPPFMGFSRQEYWSGVPSIY